MSEINWQEPFCADGGNACLQIGLSPTSDDVQLRETSLPDITISTSRASLLALIESAKRGELDHLISRT